MNARASKQDPLVIGRNEYVDIPEWGVERLRAKVDTGARSSALHVENLRELPRDRVEFDIVLDRRKRSPRVHVRTRINRHGRVRSSNGEYTDRVFVTVPVCIGPVSREIELSLVDRSKMTHRMLLGRTALSGAFLVDVSRRYLLDRD